MGSFLRFLCCQRNKNVQRNVLTRAAANLHSYYRNTALHLGATSSAITDCHCRFKLNTLGRNCASVESPVFEQTAEKRRLSDVLSYFSFLILLSNFTTIHIHYLHVARMQYSGMYRNLSTKYVSEVFHSRNYSLNHIFKSRVILNSKCMSLFGAYSLTDTHVRNMSSNVGKVVLGEGRQSWEMLVDYEKLSALETKIHERHRNAVMVKIIVLHIS